MKIEIRKPEYWITVRNAYFKDEKMQATEGVSSIKKVGVERSRAESTIYGSGLAYDMTSQTTSAQISLDAIELPNEWVTRFLGRETKNGYIIESADDRLVEFSFGYTTEYSNGKRLFKWFPRCKMTEVSDEIETKSDDNVEPVRTFVIVALPNEEGVISVQYDQNSSDVKEESMLKEEDFFSKVIKSASEIPAAGTSGATS